MIEEYDIAREQEMIDELEKTELCEDCNKFITNQEAKENNDLCDQCLWLLDK